MSADIHALEIEFAKNPSLDACIPLCEAYLAQKRFMEAMVVCKKGMKSAPDDPRGRIMLSQVYIAQGKMPKAASELNALLAQHPGNGRGMELMGRVLIEQGDKPGAIASLQGALQNDPSLTEAPGLLAQLGAPVPAAPAAPPPVAAAPAAAPPAMAPPAAAPPTMPAAAPGPAGFAAPAAAPAQPPPMAAAPAAAAPGAVPTGAAPIAAAPAVQDPGQRPPVAAPPPSNGNPLDTAGTWADSGNKKLEHVNDFFAPDTLGFSNDGSHIETAGPGRLTILGFVPKSSGSIKTTLLAITVMFVVFGVIVGYQYYRSGIVKKTNEIFGEVRGALEDDTYFKYADATSGIEAIKELDPSAGIALSAEAYIQATLALDHAEEGALAKAKTALAAAKDAVDEENKYIVAASAMIAYLDGRYEEGIAEIAAIVDRGGNDVLIQLENYRLRSKIDPEGEKTKLAFRQLLDLSSGEPRALSFLGWHYYNEGDFGRADARFDSALKNSKNHTRSLIGVTLVDLDRGIGLAERQKELEKNIKRVFALPSGELSLRDRALAHFARAQLLQWQKGPAEAKEDYDKAYEIDPDNSLFDYRRGMQLLKQGDSTQAVVFLKKAAAKDPENISVIKELVKAQLKGRDYNAALATLKRAKELAKGDKSLILLEAEVLTGQRKYSEARKLFESIGQEDGGNSLAEAYIGISSTYRVSGDSSKAVSFMQGKLEDAPKGMGKRVEARMWEEMGRGFEAIRNRDKAKQAFQVCVDTFSQYANCHCRLALAVGRGAEAQQAAKACVRVDPRGELADDVKRLLR